MNKLLTKIDNYLGVLSSHPLLHKYSLTNLLGIQIIRYPWLRFLTRIRHFFYKPNYPDHYRRVRQDGIDFIENYVSKDKHLRLDEAFTFLCSIPQAELANQEILSTSNSQALRISINDRSCSIYPEAAFIRECFLSDSKISELASDVVGYDLKTIPYMEIECITVPDDEVDIFSASQGYHVDRIQDCVKLLYFMDDVSSCDGAFEYVKGSHKTFFSKYVYQIAESFRITFHYIKSGFDENLAVISDGPGRQAFLDRFLQLDPNPVTPKSGTLSFSNHSGFHRRGTVRPGKKRRIVWFHFYREYPSMFWSKVRFVFRKIFF